jgi:hypothetical protein
MLYASDGDHPHRIQARQQHVELQVELIDRIQDSGMVSLIPIQLNDEQYKHRHYVPRYSHPLRRY